MLGRLCVVLGLVLLGALCFPALATADFQNANTEFTASISEDAFSAESVADESTSKDISGQIVNQSDLLAGIFRRRNGERRAPLRALFRGGGC